MIYSDDEENGNNIHLSSEKIARNSRIKRLSNYALKSEDPVNESRRLKRVSRNLVLPKSAKNRQAKNVLSGKDLDSISPLIKRLLVDTYEHHKREQKSSYNRGSRRRKSNIVGCDNTEEDNRRRVSLSTVNKWRSNINRDTCQPILKNIDQSNGENNQENCNTSKCKVPSKVITRERSAGKQGTLHKQRSQSLEEIVDTGCKELKSSLIKRKVINIMIKIQLPLCNNMF